MTTDLSQTFVTRRTATHPVKAIHDMSGILPHGIETALRKAGVGAILTWWRERPPFGVHRLAIAKIISRSHCIVQVLDRPSVRAHLRTVHRRHLGNDELLTLVGPARALSPIGAAWESSMLALDDAAFVIDDWIEDGRLAQSWRLE